jgi:hypothetical protein
MYGTRKIVLDHGSYSTTQSGEHRLASVRDDQYSCLRSDLRIQAQACLHLSTQNR